MSPLGSAAGRHYIHGGGGSNHLCLPEEPQWTNHTDSNALAGWLYGIEYRTHNVHDVFFSGVNNGGSTAFHGKPAPCAVCFVPQRAASVMIPALTSCPVGWTLEYTGYLMSEHSFAVSDGIRHSSPVVKFSRNGPERRSATCVWRSTTCNCRSTT